MCWNLLAIQDGEEINKGLDTILFDCIHVIGCISYDWLHEVGMSGFSGPCCITMNHQVNHVRTHHSHETVAIMSPIPNFGHRELISIVFGLVSRKQYEVQEQSKKAEDCLNVDEVGKSV